MVFSVRRFLLIAFVGIPFRRISRREFLLIDVCRILLFSSFVFSGAFDTPRKNEGKNGKGGHRCSINRQPLRGTRLCRQLSIII